MMATSIPRIVELLSESDLDVREATFNALSKFMDYGEIGLLCCVIC